MNIKRMTDKELATEIARLTVHHTATNSYVATNTYNEDLEAIQLEEDLWNRLDQARHEQWMRNESSIPVIVRLKQFNHIL